MPKFRKKPVLIEAEQWFPGDRERDCRLGIVCNPINNPMTPDDYRLMTMKGWWSHVESGDWIITDVEGDRYLCKPDIFAVTYEPA